MSDPQDLSRLVDERQLRPNAVLQAARYYLNERFDYPDPQELSTELADVPSDVDLPGRLEGDGLLLESAALYVLTVAWADPDEQERVRRAVDGAAGTLPAVDPTVVATLVLFGLQRMLRNTRRLEKTVVRTRKGTTETTTLDENGPLAVLLGALQRRRSAQPPDRPAHPDSTR
jgi:hypothetical protein